MAASRIHRGSPARRGGESGAAAPPHPRPVFRARLRTGRAADAGVSRVPADGDRARPGPENLQAGGPVVRAHARLARGHDAAGGAHRCAFAQSPRRNPLVLCGHGVAHPAFRAAAHPRTDANRRGDLRPRRPGKRCRNPDPDAARVAGDGGERHPPRHRPCIRVSCADHPRRPDCAAGGGSVPGAAGQGCSGVARIIEWTRCSHARGLAIAA